jgi:CheY-like chemotaxis protein
VTTEPSIHQELAELARGYWAQLPNRIEDIRRVMDKLMTEGWNQPDAEVLHRLAHSLAGSGSTMGFRAVSVAALELDQIIQTVLRAEASFAEAHDNMRERLTRLSKIVSQGEQASTLKYTGTDRKGPMTAPIKILVVDDDEASRSVLTAFLRADGHTVRTAASGAEAISAFQKEATDMIFMDVLMPAMSGYSAAHTIKKLCAKRFVPLIFLTQLTHEQDLVQCIDAGGDDFITKPYSEPLLRAKLRALQRTRDLHQELSRYQERTDEEMALSRHIFDAATNRNLRIDGVSHWQSRVGHFSGDMVLSGLSPTGRLVVMLGDFTGHGLGAALAAIPTSDLFYRLTNEGAALPEMAFGINRKLKTILSGGRFCAAVLLCFERGGRRVEIWNGGIPGVYCVDARGQIQHQCPSRHVPLGVLDDASFDAHTEHLTLETGTQLVCFSDGLNEARDLRGEMLGLRGVENLLTIHAASLLEGLRASVARHLAGTTAEDDISIVVVGPDEVFKSSVC